MLRALNCFVLVFAATFDIVGSSGFRFLCDCRAPVPAIEHDTPYCSQRAKDPTGPKPRQHAEGHQGPTRMTHGFVVQVNLDLTQKRNASGLPEAFQRVRIGLLNSLAARQLLSSTTSKTTHLRTLGDPL